MSCCQIRNNIGTKKGLIRRWPLSRRTRLVSFDSAYAANTCAHDHTDPIGIVLVIFNPASVTAIVLAAKAYWLKTSIFLISLRSINPPGENL